MTDRGAASRPSPDLEAATIEDRTRAWTDDDWATWFRTSVMGSDRWTALRRNLTLRDDEFVGFRDMPTAAGEQSATQMFARDPRTGAPDPDLLAALYVLGRFASANETKVNDDGRWIGTLGDTADRDFTALSLEIKWQFMAGWDRIRSESGERADSVIEGEDSIVPELTPGSGVGRNWRLWAIPIVIGGFVAGWAWLGGAGPGDQARDALSESSRPTAAVSTAPSVAGSGSPRTGGGTVALGDPVVDAVLTTAGRFSIGYDPVRLISASDEPGGWLDSDPARTVAYRGAEVDLARAVALTTRMGQSGADAAFNHSALPCFGADPLVVCAPGVLPMPEGDLLVVAVEHAGPVPAPAAERSYVYALVLDSDGDPANNWTPNPPFEWDYFGGTDRWYQATYDHTSGGWAILLTQVHAEGADLAQPTAARAVIAGAWIVWFVPVDELPVYPSPFRVTAFAHDGRLSPDSRGGDVLGADPTEALIRPPDLP